MGLAMRRPERMGLDEFLNADFGDDRRWELFDGIPVAQAAPSPEHAAIVANLCLELGQSLRRKGLPCRAEAGSGIGLSRHSKDSYLIPDVLVRCGKHPGEVGDAVVVVEVLSPSNSAADMIRKSFIYKDIPSIQEIVEIDQATFFFRVMRREGEGWTEVGGARLESVFSLPSIGFEIALGELYAGVPVEPPDNLGEITNAGFQN